MVGLRPWFQSNRLKGRTLTNIYSASEAYRVTKHQQEMLIDVA